MLMINKINSKNFRKYGWVIEYPNKGQKDKKKNLFRIVIREKGLLGWRIAYLIVRDKAIKKLQQHPESLESFEPVSGKSILYVSNRNDPKEIRSFLLDKPVILKRGIWHGIVSLGNESEIKITENVKVKCVYWPLGFELDSHSLNPAVK